MLHRRIACSFFTLLLLAGFLLWFFAVSAPAQVSSPCTATLNGVNVDSISTPGTALHVPYDGTVSVSFESKGRITSHEVWLEFFKGAGWLAADGSDDGNSWSDSVTVADYSKYGVGIYHVTGKTMGAGSCDGSAYVKVVGKNPLTTAAGAAGAAATAIGLAGMAGSTLLARRRAPKFARKAQAKASASPHIDQARESLYLGLWSILNCLYALPLAMLQTVAFMVSGAGAVGAPAVVVRWRPSFSISAILGSLLAGLGTFVLGHQYSMFFPTLTLAIIWMLVWLVAGICVSFLGHLLTVRKVNKILRQGITQESALPQQAPVPPAQVQQPVPPVQGPPQPVTEPAPPVQEPAPPAQEPEPPKPESPQQ